MRQGVTQKHGKKAAHFIPNILHFKHIPQFHSSIHTRAQVSAAHPARARPGTAVTNVPGDAGSC